MTESIGSAIKEWLRKNNLEQKVAQESVPLYWKEIVGEILAKNTEVEKIENGKMFLKTQNSTWRTEIIIRSEKIRKKVNIHFGSEVILEIIVR